MEFLSEYAAYLIIAVIIGIAAALITYFSVKRHYRFKKSQCPSVYVSNDKTVFHRQSDDFIRRYTTHVRIRSDNDHHGGHHRHHKH